MQMATSSINDRMRELKRLSRINGQINQMLKEELCAQLTSFGLDTRGTKEVLKKRLKSYYKRLKLTAGLNSSDIATSRYDYLCVIDFEATCETANPTTLKQEVIEFPAVFVCTHNRQIVHEFHRYCRPVLNPVLTDFCKELTGITQEQVDEADDFPTVLKEFETWMAKLGLGRKHRFAVVTDGPWDMGRFLYQQCEVSGVPFPKFGKKWINVRKTFSNFFGCRRMSLSHMLEFLGMAFDGRKHCGLDDARNIARIVCQLLNDGAEFQINEWISLNQCTSEAKNADDQNADNRTDQDQNRPNKQTNRRTHREQRGNKSITNSALSLDEQMRNMGIDPTLENSLENIVANKLGSKSGKK